ncbi:segregation protein B [Desulfitobacterium metallireducens DSM 15288]|uniref:Selenide, water dikinase n=1 Tax=Desulfitobacterium metallireducens DSM 15288 TaxID=871968 RepID=W0EE22_9FIRM|nr:segregation protein B [Desulfitobacterium metallireducens DSM 15288]
MRHIPKNVKDANLIVGIDTNDDAGVYKLNEEQAIVQTADFFTPVVDDPYSFGMIAAANALSDIYAMGAKPLTAMNLVAFPIKELDKSILAQILQGGYDKIREAGAILLGGHSIDDQEPKYGLSVTGIVHPQQVLSNAKAQVGDYIVLTKPLGIGIITTGIKRGLVSVEGEQEVIRVMAELNKSASEAAIEANVSSVTDITGFGLLGHLHEMMKGSGVEAQLQAQKIPILEATWDCLKKKAIPGGSLANREFLADKVVFDKEISEELQLVLCDAQTSGGLLISVPAERLEVLLESLRKHKTLVSAVIGQVGLGEPGLIKVAMN